MNGGAGDLAGCVVQAIDAATCASLIAWLQGGEKPAPRGLNFEVTLALAHCDDGVTWGRVDAQGGRWNLGHAWAPEVSPMVRQEALQELRLFGDAGEVLIWRTDDGLRGRALEDTRGIHQTEASDPLRPSDEYRIVRGDRVRGDVAGGFTRVADVTGAEQVLPQVVDDEQLRGRALRLQVRHYWMKNTVDGTVRIAATRLVRLTLGGRDGD